MYDILIIGGGITGTATFYTLSKYTNVKQVALLESQHEFGQVTSKRTNNSQTLHFGDIETNYTLEKAKNVKEAASRMRKYVESQKDERLFSKSHKIVLAVGRDEIERLEKRYKDFRKLFPKNKLLYEKEIEKIEPLLVQGRGNTPIAAYYSPDGYAMDYGRIAQSFVKTACKQGFETFLDSHVKSVKKISEGYEIKTQVRTFQTKTLLVAAGNHSLVFAHKLGYGKDMQVLPVGGNFYITPKVVEGKVYMMQDPNLPFAAVHADPEVHDNEMTRFGPVVEMLPSLERGSFKGILDFFRHLHIPGILTMMKILFTWKYFRFVLEQYVYKIPFLGRTFYMKQINKIVPTLKKRDVWLAKGYGGLRPQVIDAKNMQIHMGEAKIRGDNALFDITPSPGASTALKNGKDNALEVLGMLKGYKFFESKYKKDFS